MTLLISRNQDLAIDLLQACYHAIEGIQSQIPKLVIHNETELKFADQAHIKSLPANRSAGRGYPATRVYLDEFAFAQYAPEIYRAVSPTVSHGGQMTILSSPDGRGNQFFRLWSGQVGGVWSKHLVDWKRCPVYDEAWYAEERPKYTEVMWASEYGCDFAASGANVFRQIDIDTCMQGWNGLQPGIPKRDYVTFWDIGRKRDATVGITLDATDPSNLQLVAFERELGLPYKVTQGLIEKRWYDYPGRHLVESNGIGDPVIEGLRVPVEGWLTTRKSKIDSITSLALALEHGWLRHDIDQLTVELQNYQWEDSSITQDCVISLAGACYCALNPPLDDALIEYYDPVEISPY